MTTRAKMMAVVVAAGMLGVAARGTAGEASMDLTCWTGYTSPITTYTWAQAEIEETASTTKTQSFGYKFTNVGDTIECTFRVPADYDRDAAGTPQLHLFGWTEGSQSCTSGTKFIKFGVTSRAYANDEVLTDAWPTVTTATMSYDCVTNGCGVPFNCYQADHLVSNNATATANASDWVVDDLVFVKISRDTVTNELAQAFHLARVKLIYPTP